MAEWRAPEAVAVAGRPRAVGFTRRGVVDAAAWQRRVDAWQLTLEARRGQAIALLEADPLEFAAALWAAWHGGCRPVLPPNRQTFALAQLEASVDAWIGPAPGALEAAAPPPQPLPREPLDPAQTKLTLFTSGFCSQPVGQNKTLGQLAIEVAALERSFGDAMGRGPVFTTVSQQHIYGLLYGIVWPLAAGRAIYSHGREALPGLPAALYGTLVTDPAFLRRLAPGASAAKFSAVFSSGGALPASTAEATHRALGCYPFELYGSTETGGIAWRRASAAWQVFPGVRLSLVAGRLAVASPYLAQPEPHVTEDLATLESGALHLMGRADHVVEADGERTSLGAMERALERHPWVGEAQAVVLDERRQSLGVALVLSSEGEAARDTSGWDEVRRALCAQLAGAFGAGILPRRWQPVAALPVDGVGKTTQEQLRRLFDAGTPGPDAATLRA